MFGYVKKSTHDAVVAELDRMTDRLAQERENVRYHSNAAKAWHARAEALEAELAPLKAARQRSTANLMAWNARGKAAVQEDA